MFAEGSGSQSSVGPYGKNPCCHQGQTACVPMTENIVRGFQGSYYGLIFSVFYLLRWCKSYPLLLKKNQIPYICATLWILG